MKTKKIIYTTLLIVWMIVIFLFSNQNAEKSEFTSDKVASTIINTVETVTKHDIPKEEKHSFIEDTRVIIRKTAHFSSYLVLGILAFLTIKSYTNQRIVLYTIIFCFLYACSDEIHQLFSTGRTCRILDILIDTSGSVVGSSLISTLNKIFINKLSKSKSSLV